MLFAASVIEIKENNRTAKVEKLDKIQILAMQCCKIVNQFSFKKFGAKFSRSSIDSSECVKPA